MQVLDTIRRCSVTDNTESLGQSASASGPNGGGDEKVLNANQPATTGNPTPGGPGAGETHRVNQPIAIRSTSSEARR